MSIGEESNEYSDGIFMRWKRHFRKTRGLAAAVTLAESRL